MIGQKYPMNGSPHTRIEAWNREIEDLIYKKYPRLFTAFHQWIAVVERELTEECIRWPVSLADQLLSSVEQLYQKEKRILFPAILQQAKFGMLRDNQVALNKSMEESLAVSRQLQAVKERLVSEACTESFPENFPESLKKIEKIWEEIVEVKQHLYADLKKSSHQRTKE